MEEIKKELSSLKEQCLINFSQGIKHDTRELAEKIVLIENQIYQICYILERALYQKSNKQ